MIADNHGIPQLLFPIHLAGKCAIVISRMNGNEAPVRDFRRDLHTVRIRRLVHLFRRAGRFEAAVKGTKLLLLKANARITELRPSLFGALG